MRWPWTREKRAGYTDVLVDALIARAGGDAGAAAESTAAVEFAAAMMAHAFASAEVSPDTAATRAVSPAFLGLVGRALVTTGELVAVIQVDAEGVALRPTASHEVSGGAAPQSWRYRVELPAPSRPEFRIVPAGAVVHLRYSVDAARPWKGVGPLARANLTAKLAAGAELRLGQEAGARVGYVLPIPTDGQDATVEDLRRDLAALAGQTALVETTLKDWGRDGPHTGRADWRPARLGASPPAPAVELRRDAALAALAACGVPPMLYAQGSDGSGQREAWRRFLHGTVAPLGAIVAAELGDKLDAPVALSFERLFASDLAGRARAFASMVAGGMDAAKAAAVSGLMGAE